MIVAMMKPRACPLRRSAVWMLFAFLAPSAALSGGPEEMARKFAESEFVFTRARSDIPFVPLAWADAALYDESRFIGPSGEASDVSFEQRTLSEGTLIPFLLGRRDALVVGQWINWTRFDLSSGEDREVVSIALPIGWARQWSADWQLAAFVAPLGHASDDDWYWEYMGGVFARWLQGDRFAWLFGVYADVAPLEEYYIPYAGVAWTVNQHWTLSAVMPWPALLYAPGPDWFLRLGVAPSDAGWSAKIDSSGSVAPKPELNFSSWNFGLSIERRFWKNFWMGAEAGVSGLRGFSFVGSDWEGPNSDLGSEGYVSLTINYRPAAPRSQ